MEKQILKLKVSAIIGEKQTPDAVIVYSSIGTFVCEKDSKKYLDCDTVQFALKPKRV